MADFKTPLPIHKAAFARIGPGLDLPDAGREDLRKAFQAGERRGAATREIEIACGDVLGRYVWCWPWLEQCAAAFDADGIWPADWPEHGLGRPFDWHRVPHNGRVWLVVATLSSALYAARDNAQFAGLDKAAVKSMGWFQRLVAEPKCPASRHVVAHHAPRIAAGDFSRLPPFFPGDPSYLRLGDPRRR